VNVAVADRSGEITGVTHQIYLTPTDPPSSGELSNEWEISNFVLHSERSASPTELFIIEIPHMVRIRFYNATYPSGLLVIHNFTTNQTIGSMSQVVSNRNETIELDMKFKLDGNILTIFIEKSGDRGTGYETITTTVPPIRQPIIRLINTQYNPNSNFATGNYTIHFPTDAPPVEIPNFHFSKIFDSYFTENENEFSSWNLLTMSRELYETSMGSFVFWALLFVAVYFALHITTGGTFIPAAVFAAVGAILIIVMPVEFSIWAQLGLIIGLFIIPIYRYFKE